MVRPRYYDKNMNNTGKMNKSKKGMMLSSYLPVALFFKDN